MGKNSFFPFLIRYQYEYRKNRISNIYEYNYNHNCFGNISFFIPRLGFIFMLRILYIFTKHELQTVKLIQVKRKIKYRLDYQDEYFFLSIAIH